MNGALIFIGIGVGIWAVSVIYKITVCADTLERVPNWKEFNGYAISERDRRNIRAARIGAIFFTAIGLFAGYASRNDPKAYLNMVDTLYILDRFLLVFLAYLNVSMRLLIHRLTKGDWGKGMQGIMTSFKTTGLFPQGGDLASGIVRWTNVLIILATVLMIVLLPFIQHA